MPLVSFASLVLVLRIAAPEAFWAPKRDDFTRAADEWRDTCGRETEVGDSTLLENSSGSRTRRKPLEKEPPRVEICRMLCGSLGGGGITYSSSLLELVDKVWIRFWVWRKKRQRRGYLGGDT